MMPSPYHASYMTTGSLSEWEMRGGFLMYIFQSNKNLLVSLDKVAVTWFGAQRAGCFWIISYFQIYTGYTLSFGNGIRHLNTDDDDKKGSIDV